MKFAHLADCHLGAWRDDKLKDLNSQAFSRAIEISIEEKVDFILISGDLFNTAIPGIDRLKEVARAFKDLQTREIPVYMIAGSHDYSPSGKTMLDVLEEAGLCINVCKGQVHEGKLRLGFTSDEKTGAKITGVLGRRGMLDKSYYNELDHAHLEKEKGFKIFMFHTAITELKPESMGNMESQPISLLPKGFNYYAGGHVHIIEKKDLPGYRNVIYPGPTFPNNFHELEELKEGGFYIYDEGDIKRVELELKKVICMHTDAEHKKPAEIRSEIADAIRKKDLSDSIVLLRISGVLETGKPSDIDFAGLYEEMYAKGAYFVMRNTSKLQTKEFEQVQVASSSAEDIEDRLIVENVGQDSLFEDEKSIVKGLMQIMSQEKKEGEKNYEYDSRIARELSAFLGI
jgi:DNA repair protein SbcD/Mre11